MKLIDFDKQFEKYLRQWMAENQKKYPSIDEMEAAVPAVYDAWLAQPAAWLAGEAPGAYFERFSDPAQLTEMLRGYIARDMALPDPLLNRLSSLGAQAEDALCSLAGDITARDEARMTAIGLLREIQSEKPLALYLAWLKGNEMDELIENAVESMKNMGKAVLEPCLALTKDPALSIEKRECLADLLSAFPGDDRVLAFLSDTFAQTGNKALLASYIGRFGDEKALPLLEKALLDPKINYLDYTEIANAIGELGGEVKTQREFSGDPYYESLRQMQ